MRYTALMSNTHYGHDDGGRDKALCLRHETWSDAGEVCPQCQDRIDEARRIKAIRKAESKGRLLMRYAENNALVMSPSERLTVAFYGGSR